MDTGFQTSHLYTACKLTFRHYYQENDHSYEKYGTGFVSHFPPPDSRLAIVTNRHLADMPWTDENLKSTLLASIKVEMWQSDKFRLEFQIENPTPIFHDDQSIDIAVIPFGPEFDRKTVGYPYAKLEDLLPDKSASTLMLNHALSWEYLLECERLWSQLRPGQFVVFPGYPIWYDKLQIRPVFRSGMIASDPQTDYRKYDGPTTNQDGNQQVLFDAFSTSGNSGSPVFAAQTGIPPFELIMKTNAEDTSPTTAAKMEFSPFHKAFLIGINAGHFNDTESEKPSAHAGLSRMHKLSAIMDILRSNIEPSSGLATIKISIPADLAKEYDQ